MAGFDLQQGVQFGAGLTPVNKDVEDLSKDLLGLFGAVNKGVESYNIIGENAAKLEFQSQSREASDAITELNRKAVGQENNPKFWDDYNNEINAITNKVVAEREKFKNHKAAYDVYNESSLDFSSSIKSKYIPFGEQKQFDATKTLLVANEDEYLNSIESAINNDIMSQSKERLMMVGYDRDTASAWVEGKAYGSLFNSMDSAIELMPKNEIQNSITLPDGELNKDNAVALFNMTSGNSELTKAFVDKEGNIQIKNTSEDTKIQDDASKRMQMILAHWSKPTDAGYINRDYAELGSKLKTYSVNHANAPKDVIQAYDNRDKARYDFMLTDGYKRLTISEKEKFEADMNTDLALKQGYHKAVELYDAGGIALFNNLADTQLGTFKNIYGHDENIVISPDMIASVKEFGTSSISVQALNGQIPIMEANNINIQKTGKPLPILELTHSMIQNGTPSASFESAKGNVEFMSRAYQQDTKSLTPSEIQWMNDSNAILAKREQGVYKTDQEAKIALDQVTKTASDTARKMNIGLSTEIRKYTSKYATNTFGFDSQYKAGTASYIAGHVDKLGNDWLTMSDGEKADYIGQFITTTQPSAVERGTAIDTYVVPKLKYKGGTYLEDVTLHNGVDGIINTYNKNHKTNYGTDDFVFDSSRNGNIKVSVKGVTVYSELTAENMQYFAKYKESVSHAPTRSEAEAIRRKVVQEKKLKSVTTAGQKASDIATGKTTLKKEASKEFDINLNRAKKNVDKLIKGLGL